MKKFSVFILLGSFLLFSVGISAGDLRNEYYKVRSQVNDAEKSGNEEVRKKQLEETLSRSLRLVMLRRYQYPDYDKIKVGDFDYEKSDLNEYTYFIRYKDYVGYFSYSSDPAEYYNMPRDYRIYQKPDDSYENSNDSHSSESENSDSE